MSTSSSSPSELVGTTYREELRKLIATGNFHASYSRLTAFPMQIFMKRPSIDSLVRLDVSNNKISELPLEIALLNNLKELWINSNPIKEIPSCISDCSKLEIIDIRNTLINDLPSTICQLKKLYEIDWRDSPLQTFLEIDNNISFGDLRSVLGICRYRFDRSNLRAELQEALSGEHFASDLDKPNIQQRINAVVDMAYECFTDLEEFKIFVRRVDKLLPHEIDLVHENSMVQAREAFYKLRDDTTRQRLAADVEIKLRGLYYDMVEPPVIEAMIKGIYEHVLTLEDVQFLVKYAKQVMPENPSIVTGKLIWDNILDLQNELIEKRNKSVAGLVGAMASLYPEQEQSALNAKGQEIAAFYQRERFATKKELDNVSQLTAEVSKLLPPDFMSVIPSEVYDKAVQKFGGKRRSSTADRNTAGAATRQ